MPKLLYIESSPRRERSHSSAVARAFLDAYRSAHPDAAVDEWDLWAPAERLPEFDGAAITAKYAVIGGATHSPPEADAWATIGRSVDRLKAADVLLFSVPMWNFGVPYKLKHLVDVVTQPGLTFTRDPARGLVGLVTGKRAVVVSARGGAYAPGTQAAALDMESPYVERWLGLIGVTDVRSVYVEPTAGGEAVGLAARERAAAEARTLAAGY